MRLFDQPVSAVFLMFGAVISGLALWIAHHDSIQSALLAAQNLIFGILQ